MNLVWIFLAIALAGVVALACYAVWLWHKANDVFSELEMLGRRGEEAAALIDQFRLPGDHAGA